MPRDETVEDALDQASEELRNSDPPEMVTAEEAARAEAELTQRAYREGERLQPGSDE